jgi:hypothetical protein
MGYGGRVFDTVGSAHEVSRTGIVKPVPGIRAFEGAMYFGRTTGALSAYVAMGSPPAYATIATVECWFRTERHGYPQMIMGAGTSADTPMVLGLEADGRVFGALPRNPNVGVWSSTAYDDGAWHHVVLRDNAGTLELWVDATLVAQTTAGSILSRTVDLIRIGTTSTVPSTRWRCTPRCCPPPGSPPTTTPGRRRRPTSGSAPWPRTTRSTSGGWTS